MILSIIIPVYNVEKFVKKCVISCERQNIPSDEYEVICVNDGSQDNSLQIVEELAELFDNIKVFSQPNGGLSVARNTGMQHARGDYYMFVDSDDWIEENCLASLTLQLKRDRPDCLAICGANVYGDTIKKRRSHPDESIISGPDYLIEGAQHGAPFAIWSSSFFKKHDLRFVEGIYHEDSEFTPRAYYLAQRVARTNSIIYYVFQNPNSITRTHKPKRAFDLVNVVLPSLYNFSKTVEEKYKFIFFDRIGILLSTAINEICYASNEERKEFISSINKFEGLVESLSNSSINKYKREALFVKKCPGLLIESYRLLKKIRVIQ